MSEVNLLLFILIDYESEPRKLVDILKKKKMLNNIQAVLRIRVRIQEPVPFWPLDPGFGMGKKLGSGSGMNNPNHISEKTETVFGLKYLNSLMRIQGPGWNKFGSEIGMEKNRIRDKHPGSPTLHSGWVDDLIIFLS